ncbi:TetR/AcrR family transcriptional regulator [Streptococcus cuniculipharyngis]|uniref:TetR family transcriptional regulator n=1 Tax=Streptococcus cuniculipharyngis TaxID=1562651 RepID=A0A5C5SAZ9_9STRE|nr:TetR/AcrR family transcriptional regulator [Streptococcus cuniculipharyngis]TWS96939.1 TetR family transcriptional regulator [Streptococcus cuniculipharyngis]
MRNAIHNPRQTVDLRKPAQRQTQSKAKIQTALAKLLNQTSFDQISVTAICQEAQINRGTFYLHYLDKFDLIEQLAEEIKDQLLLIFREGEQAQEDKLLQGLCYFKEQKDLIRALLKLPQLDFLSQIQLFMESLWQANPYFQKEDLSLLDLPPNYAQATFIASLHAILATWIDNNCQEDTTAIRAMLLSLRQLYAPN